MTEQKVVIAEDLKPCLKIQQQILRCFRSDQDAVSGAERTIDLIERTFLAESKLAEAQQEKKELLKALEDHVSDGKHVGPRSEYLHALIQKHRSQA